MSESLLRSVHHVPGVRGFVRKQVLRVVARGDPVRPGVGPGPLG